MPKRVWWWIGGSALAALGLWAVWAMGSVSPATIETQVRLRIWLPTGPSGVWLLLGLGSLAVLPVAARLRPRRRVHRTASAAAPRPAPQPEIRDSSSAFAVDPWEDTALVFPHAPPQVTTRAEQITTLHAAAEYLVQCGRLRAAREAYLQAYELAMQAPPLHDRANELAARIHTLERRLAQHGWRAKASS